MNDLTAPGQYDQELTHLVRAHGAEADRLIGYALNVTQLRWAHFDTHAALDIAQVRPPDGHIHPALADPGGPGRPSVSYRPFLPSPALAGKALPLSAPCRFLATREYTGLPQTGATPPANSLEDVTGCWSSAAAELTVSAAQRQARGEADPDQALAEYRGQLRILADAVAARWQETRQVTAVDGRARWLADGRLGIVAAPAGPGSRPARRTCRPVPHTPRPARRR